VFISYRREETAGHAGRLYDAIAARFGDDNVFMDVDLAPGIDFVEQITDAVGVCDVLLVVIGPSWATGSAAHGRARLEDPNDFVRLEVETALRRPDVTVIPLLVAGARMPDPSELPEDLRALSRRNALELSDLRWRYDIGRLVNTLAELLEKPSGRSEGAPPPPEEQPPPTPEEQRPRTLPTRGRRVRLGAIVATLALGAGVAVLAIAGVFSTGTHTGQRQGTTGAGSRDATTDDAVRLVGTYKKLYEAKDVNGLRRLLDPDVVFKKGNEQQLHGIDKVLAQYAAEFKRFGKHNPTFDWQTAHSDATQNELEVAGSYVLSVDDRRETGRFGFLIRNISSSLMITEICFQCPDLRPGGVLATIRLPTPA
jgi:hypothetical protein